MAIPGAPTHRFEWDRWCQVPPELVPFTDVATSLDVRMRILVAHSFYGIAGGEDRYVRQQVELLARSHVVHLEERVNAELHEGQVTAAARSRPAGRRCGRR